MATVKLPCPVVGCPGRGEDEHWQTQPLKAELAKYMLNIHMEHVHPQAQQPPQHHGLNQSSEGKRDKPVLKSRKKKRKKEKQFIITDPSTCNPVMEETVDMV